MKTRLFFISIASGILLPGLLWAGSMQIDAARMEILQKSNLVTFSGNVHLKRDDFVLYCDRLEARYGQDKSQLESAEAFGHVKILQGENTGRADKAKLDQKQNKITLIGNAVLEQPGGRIQGETIIHDLTRKRTEVFPVKGGKVRMTIETADKKTPVPPAAK
jgi:lipopolysaccharide transport protein LptA